MHDFIERLDELLRHCLGEDVNPPWTEWVELTVEAEAFGIALPRIYDTFRRTTGVLIRLLYSAKEGAPVGYKWPRLVNLGHYCHTEHPEFLRPFRRALFRWERMDQIRKEDANGKWAAKAAGYRARLEANDPVFAEPEEHQALVALLFPELSEVEESGAKLRFVG